MGEMKPKIEITAGFPPEPGPVQTPAQMRLELVPFLRGERGLPGSSASVVATAALGGHRVVTVEGQHAEPDDANLVAGITTASASIGETADVVVKGLIEEGSWSWTPDAPVFIGAAGVLTQSPSTTGLIRRIAWAVSPTVINVDIMPPVLQA